MRANEEKIIDRLRKLIAHERSAREIGSLAEAAKFAAKIQQLLDDYNLSMSDVEVEEARESVDSQECSLNTSNLWQKQFLQDVAEINGCRMILKGRNVLIVGNEVDRLVTIEIFRYFEALGRDMALLNLTDWQRTRDYRLKRKKAFHSRRFTTSFLYGYIVSLTRRMKDQKEASMAEANNQTGLIYIGNKLADANAFVQKNLTTKTHQGKGLKGRQIRDEAYMLGRMAGDQVALTTKTFE